jgi:hypothetical protein
MKRYPEGTLETDLTSEEVQEYRAAMAAATTQEEFDDLFFAIIWTPPKKEEDWTGLDDMWAKYVADSRARA